MQAETYNGWKNYETWCVALWMSNDQANYHETTRMAEQAVEDETETYELADALKSYVEDLPEADEVLEQATFVSDLLRAALSEVDWFEIAENLMAEAKS